MTSNCWHHWLITQEGLRRGQLRLRVRCSRCGKEQIWWPEQIDQAANGRWWRKHHPLSRA